MKPLKAKASRRTDSAALTLNQQNAVQGELPAQHAGAAVAPPRGHQGYRTSQGRHPLQVSLP